MIKDLWNTVSEISSGRNKREASFIPSSPSWQDKNLHAPFLVMMDLVDSSQKLQLGEHVPHSLHAEPEPELLFPRGQLPNV